MVVSMQAESPDQLNEPRLTQLYRETPRSEPSEELDSAILATARREVRARPQHAGSALRRWHVPASIAAVVVLSVTVVTLVMEHGGGELADTPPRGLTERTTTAPQALRDRIETPPVTAEPQAPPAPEVAPAPAAASLPATEQRQAPPAAAALRDRADATTSAQSGAKASAEAGAEVEARSKRQAPIAGTADTPPGRQEAVAPGPKLREDALAASPAPGAPESRADAAPTPNSTGKAAAPQPRVAPAQDTLRSYPAEGAMREQRVPLRQIEPARKGMAAPSVPTQLSKALEGEPPERWLEKIDELRRSDRVAEAEELLAAFRKRFPDHPAAAKP